MRLTRRRFRRADFSEYQSWFQYPEVSKWLGDIDQDWLDYILTDTGGVEYAFTQQNRLIAVAGIVLPQAGHPAAAITNLAICPKLFRRGVGSAALRSLVYEPTDVFSSNWIAFVEDGNTAAHALLKKNGWSLSDEAPIDSMVKHHLLR